MNITGDQLARQYRAAIARMPWLHEVEAAYGLPPFTLAAVASRETNLDPYYETNPGDGGHGRGLWQLDDRSWDIPDPFPVRLQAEKAAELLRNLVARFGLDGALNAYNSGQPKVQHTTGKDYSTDVLERLAYLTEHFAAVTNPFGSLAPEQQAEMYETTKATNAAMGRVEVAVRDSTSGIGARLTALAEALGL